MHRLRIALLAVVAATTLASWLAASALAADPAISLTAEPLMGGSFKSGTWVAVRVTVENNGPAVGGELRMTSTLGASTFGVPVELATNARQQHILYSQAGPFGRRFELSLVDRGGTVHASAQVPIEAITTSGPTAFVVAEQPQSLVGPVRDGLDVGGRAAPVIVTTRPEDLPPQVQPWESIDILVWQDVDSNRLDAPRIEALRTWVHLGGRLVILGGTTGLSSLDGFPADLLPFRPSHVVDVPVADLESLLGGLPAGAVPAPALAGTLEQGVAIATSADDAYAAQVPVGRGSVALVGLNPATAWLAGSAAEAALWSRILPTENPAPRTTSVSDSYIVDALGTLPAVQLPPFEQLFAIIAAYVVTIGPLNYLVLRRRDRREWGWLTMPAIIGLFAIGAYAFGVVLRGSSVVVNELAIVNGSVGADRGSATVYVGVYSPTRSSFDVRVGGNVLLSAPTQQAEFDGPRRDAGAVEVLLGDPAVLRGYDVGFGVQRAFRSESAASVPRVDADLELSGDAVQGTLTNSSAESLSDVSIVWGNGIQRLGDIAPGASVAVSVAPLSAFNESIGWRMYPFNDRADTAQERSIAARRAIVTHLDGGWNAGFDMSASAFSSGPVVLAWASGPTLDIDVGTSADRVGERLYLLPARVRITGPVVFSGGLLQRSAADIDAIEGFEEGGSYILTRGTIATELRPAGLDGVFEPTDLLVRVGSSSTRAASEGDTLAPLPAAEQPDSESPLTSDPRPDAMATMPHLQLYDRVAETWLEFEPVTSSRTYRIAFPERFVDESGAVRVRFVVRNSQYAQFTFDARLEGNVR